MHSVQVHALQGLRQRVRELDKKAVRLETLRGQLRSDLNRKKLAVEEGESKVELLLKISELFRVLMDNLVNDQIGMIQRVISEGYAAVFPDQTLNFEAELTTKRSRAWVDLFIRSGGAGNPLSHRGRPLENFGGGVTSLTSLILRLLVLMRLKKFPLLVLDESLGAISDVYIDQTGPFIQNLVRESGIDVLLITHKAPYADYADQAYQGSLEQKGDVTHLGVSRLR